jgi:hypothetical protein
MCGSFLVLCWSLCPAHSSEVTHSQLLQPLRVAQSNEQQHCLLGSHAVVRTFCRPVPCAVSSPLFEQGMLIPTLRLPSMIPGPGASAAGRTPPSSSMPGPVRAECASLRALFSVDLDVQVLAWAAAWTWITFLETEAALASWLRSESMRSKHTSTLQQCAQFLNPVFFFLAAARSLNSACGTPPFLLDCPSRSSREPLASSITQSCPKSE